MDCLHLRSRNGTSALGWWLGMDSIARDYVVRSDGSSLRRLTPIDSYAGSPKNLVALKLSILDG